jgi:hypothetical protein
MAALESSSRQCLKSASLGIRGFLVVGLLAIDLLGVGLDWEAWFSALTGLADLEDG